VTPRLVHVWSWKQIEAMTDAPDPDAVLISITSPMRPTYDNRHGWRRVLRLCFADATPEGAIADPMLKPWLFMWEEARDIIEFARQNLHCDWHVHCDAGKSRSMAVGSFLADAAGRELKIHSRPSDEWRNLHVLRVLRRAAEAENLR